MRRLPRTETIGMNSRIGRCGIFLVVSVVFSRLRIGSEFHCIRPTPTEMQSMSKTTTQLRNSSDARVYTRGSVRRASSFVQTGKPEAILDDCRPSVVAMKCASLNSAAS